MINDTLHTHTMDTKFVPFGIRLKSAREARGLASKEAAMQLRLSETVISMLESENYPADLPVTFIRGYIRAYGKLLDIPDAEIKQALEPIQPKPVPLVEQKPLEPITSGNYFVQIFTYLIIFTLISLVGIWWYSHSRTETQLSIPTSVPVTQNTVQPRETLPAPKVNPATQPPVVAKMPENASLPAKPEANQAPTKTAAKSHHPRFITDFAVFFLAGFIILWRYKQIKWPKNKSRLSRAEMETPAEMNEAAVTAGLPKFDREYEIKKTTRIFTGIILVALVGLIAIWQYTHSKQQVVQTTVAKKAIPMAVPVNDKTLANQAPKVETTPLPPTNNQAVDKKKVALKAPTSNVDPYDTEADSGNAD